MVGTDGKNSLAYRITYLDSSGISKVLNQTPDSISNQYLRLRFYACEVVGNYIFIVGETEKRGGSLVEYS